MTKKKMFSRVFAVSLVLCLMVALAVPNFAMEAKSQISPRTPLFTSALYHLGDKAYLNCYGEQALNSNGRDVTVYDRFIGSDQSWTFDDTVGGYHIKSGTSDPQGNIYALNLHGYRDDKYLNCDVMKLAGNERDATIQCFSPVNKPILDYGLTLCMRHGYYTQYYLGVRPDSLKPPYYKTAAWMTGDPYNTANLQWAHAR